MHLSAHVVAHSLMAMFGNYEFIFGASTLFLSYATGMKGISIARFSDLKCILSVLHY